MAMFIIKLIIVICFEYRMIDKTLPNSVHFNWLWTLLVPIIVLCVFVVLLHNKSKLKH